MDFTLFPYKGNRKLAGFYYALALYILGCIATSVAVDGYTVTAIFGIFAGANYGEHKANGKT